MSTAARRKQQSSVQRAPAARGPGSREPSCGQGALLQSPYLPLLLLPPGRALPAPPASGRRAGPARSSGLAAAVADASSGAMRWKVIRGAAKCDWGPGAGGAVLSTGDRQCTATAVHAAAASTAVDRQQAKLRPLLCDRSVAVHYMTKLPPSFCRQGASRHCAQRVWAAAAGPHSGVSAGTAARPPPPITPPKRGGPLSRPLSAVVTWSKLAACAHSTATRHERPPLNGTAPHQRRLPARSHHGRLVTSVVDAPAAAGGSGGRASDAGTADNLFAHSALTTLPPTPNTPRSLRGVHQAHSRAALPWCAAVR